MISLGANVLAGHQLQRPTREVQPISCRLLFDRTLELSTSDSIKKSVLRVSLLGRLMFGRVRKMLNFKAFTLYILTPATLYLI